MDAMTGGTLVLTALASLGLWRWTSLARRRRVALSAWLLMPLYNQWILSTCPGDCGIRADLVLVLPVLLGLTLYGFWPGRGRSS